MLAGKTIEILVEDSFHMIYHAGIQPSEVDRLSTYEFNNYLKLLETQMKSDQEYDFALHGINLNKGNI